MIECPPGIGKTGIAQALSRLWGDRTHFVTGTKQLQTQYLETPGMTEVRGRPNFMCLVDPKIGADKAYCVVGEGCEYAGAEGLDGCPYWDQKREGMRSGEVVFNYAYWLPQMNYAGWPKPDNLILDEAHTLKNHVASFATERVNRSLLSYLDIPEPASDSFEDHQLWSSENLDTVTTEFARLKKQHPAIEDQDAIRALSRTRALAETMRTVAKSAHEWIVVPDKWGWEYKPVWVSDLIPNLVLRHAKRVVFLSASLLSKDAFCLLHGISSGEAEFIQMPSIFDPAKRPIRYWPQGKVSKREGYGEIISAVKRILALHPSDRGLVHTVSYKLAEEIMSQVPDSRLLTHVGATREQILEEFKETPGSVLVSPSMSTGVDLPYDLCRFQIICKLPFPDLGDRQIKAAMKDVECPECKGLGCQSCRNRGTITDRRGQMAYNYDTVATLVQMYGRGMRAEDDACITYLLDGNWKWFRAANRDLLPRWFTEAVQNWSGGYQTTEQVLSELRARYGA